MSKRPLGGVTVRYILGRLFLMLPTILLASVVIFLVLRVMPGDIVMNIMSDTQHTVEMREALREELGLDEPLPVQYGRWLWGMVTGQFGGRSLRTREPIGEILARQLPITVLLTVYSLAAAFSVSVPLGIAAAVWRDRWPDKLIKVSASWGLAVPVVWTALLAILFLLTVFKWSPPIRYTSLTRDPANHLQMMAVPAALLAWELGSHLVRVVRAVMIEILEAEYVTAARARGISEWSVVMRHGFRNALVSVVTLVGLHFGTLMGGALVLETVFGLPGIGRGLVDAALARDFPVVMSVSTVLVLLYLGVNLAVDLSYVFFDPRISHGD